MPWWGAGPLPLMLEGPEPPPRSETPQQQIGNKLAFGLTRFAAAADPIEHISEEKFLLQIFAKMETLRSNFPQLF